MWRWNGTERAGSSDGVPPWTRLEHQARYDFAGGFVRGGAVVDCACGDGAGTRTYLRGRPDLLLGFELDAAAVEAAARTITHPAVRFEVGDATDLPCADGSVDLYISLETIEHVRDAEAVVREAARVLRPTGRFICSTPNRLVSNPGSTQADKPICGSHVREFTHGEFLSLLRPFFSAVTPYGQNEVGSVRRLVLGALQHVPHRRLAARAGQAVKLTRLVHDSAAHHAVVPVAAGRVYDFTIAVCDGPRAPLVPADV